jgi:nicotinamide phosphoribosyltransferase
MTYYYIESRGGADRLMFFGLQAVIKKILIEVPTKEQVEMAKVFWTAHGVPFNYDGWMKIVELGYYPLEIKAVPEGTLAQTKKPIVTVQNTIDGYEWLAGWAETRLLQVWYPITVATKSYECKQVIKNYLEKTGTPEDIAFKLHSFGYRGVSSEESAAIGGSAELVNFMGTDTVAGIIEAQDFYNTDNMLGFSIPAAEHSTVTAWGIEFELDAYRNMIEKFAKKDAIVAVVSDSYNLENAVEEFWCKELRQEVINSGATVVIRPDSGEPKDIVLRTVMQLDKYYGCTINDKGYRVLNNVRVIQGDGIGTPADIELILKTLTDAGYSADNLAFGMGGGSLQQVNRDTLKFAMKLSAVKRSGVWQDAYKCPADAPWKASKAGRFDYRDLNTVWKDGNFVKEYTFEEVRENANV